MVYECASKPATEVVTLNETNVSPLTGHESNNTTGNDENIATKNNVVSGDHKKSTGRKLGSTHEAKQEYLQKIQLDSFNGMGYIGLHSFLKDRRLININVTKTPRTTNNNVSLDLSTINTEGLTITGFVDLILVEKLNDDGRRQRFAAERERRKKQKQELRNSTK
jgi:hypothetical protein